jgi:hypothetical protein
MSETYFDILPEEIIVTILCNFTYDKGIYSLLNLLSENNLFSKSKVFRQICIRIFPEMKMYPEEISVEGIKLSWQNIYQTIIVYANEHVIFDKYEFYVKSMRDKFHDIIILILWNYFQDPEKEILFIGTLFTRERFNLDIYYSTYFKFLIDCLVGKRYVLLKEKIKTMKPLESIYNFMIDIEGNKVTVVEDPYLEVILLYPKDNIHSKLSEAYRKGYDGVSGDY